VIDDIDVTQKLREIQSAVHLISLVSKYIIEYSPLITNIYNTLLLGQKDPGSHWRELSEAIQQSVSGAQSPRYLLDRTVSEVIQQSVSGAQSPLYLLDRTVNEAIQQSVSGAQNP
jgi:hypothetical protein